MLKTGLLTNFLGVLYGDPSFLRARKWQLALFGEIRPTYDLKACEQRSSGI